jgi:RHS repeat-associated protein
MRVIYIIAFVFCFLQSLCLQAQSHAGELGHGRPAVEDESPSKKQKSSSAVNVPVISFALVPPAPGTFNLYSDSLALVDLYNSTNGPQWTNKTNWLVGKVSTWYGITVTTSRVVKINLPNNNLSGNLPNSLGDLRMVNYIDLSQGNLTGIIPTSIVNLTLIKYLWFHKNQLTGSIPSNIGNLNQLITFYTYNNNLSGDLPPSMASLTKLQNLCFHNNANLTGNFDWIGNMPAMLQFWFSGTSLDCTIPSSVGNLTKMVSFVGGGYVADNVYRHQKLHGTIPSTLGNCKLLQLLRLDDTDLTGSIPTTLKNLTALTLLSVFNNKNLSGDLNSIIGSTKLNALYTFNSKVGGAVPTTINGSTIFFGFDVGKTPTTGPLPDLSKSSGMLWFGMDSIPTFQFPSWIANMTGLYYVSAKANNLTTLPDFSANPNKANLEIYIQNNNLGFAALEPFFTGNGVSPYKKLLYSPQTDIGTAQSLTWDVLSNNTLTVTASGNYNVYQWQKNNASNWVDLGNKTASQLNFPVLTPSDSGRYRLKITSQRVTDLTLYSKVFKVVVNGTIPQPVINDQTFCANQTFSLTATGVDGGVFKWYENDVDVNPIFTGATFDFPMGLSTTTPYFVSQEIQGVPSARKLVTITINPLPIVNANDDVSICQNQSTTLTVTGDAASYNWSNGLGTLQSFSITPTITTAYSVTGMSAAGCTATDQVTVTVYTPVAVITPAAPTVCANTLVTLTGSGGATYNWSEGTTSNAISVTPQTTTVYTLSVVDDFGCTATTQATIAVNPLPIIQVSPDLEICKGQSAGISVSGDADQYAWDQGLGSELSFEVSPVTTTHYSVIGTSTFGCQTTKEVVVTVHPLPNASITPQSIGICDGASTTLTASGGIIFQWNTGESTKSKQVTPVATTNYTVNVTDNRGCTNSSQATVVVDPNCPAAPSDLRVISISGSQIQLTWKNNATNQTGFKIERASLGGNFVLIGTVNAATLKFIDHNLNSSTTYKYRARAYNSQSESETTTEEHETTFSDDQNYISEIIVLKDNVTDANELSSLNVAERINTIHYLDGELRPIQEIVQQYSPAQNDLVKPISYDQMGRSSVDYLPYTIYSSNPGSIRINALGQNSEQTDYYNGNNTPSNVPVEALNPFSQTQFENSPLNRINKLSSQGSPWNLNGGKVENVVHGTNSIADKILQWKVTDSGVQALKYFDVNELSKVSVTTEDQNVSETYTDKSSKNIFERSSLTSSTWASSYSVYNDKQELVYKLTPLAVSMVENQVQFPKTADKSILDELCFQYQYDNKHRQIMTKAPGLAPVYFVYDKWNRVVLSQNGNQRLTNQWSFNKFDSWNRVIVTGLITDTRSQQSIQQALLTQSLRFESRDDNAGNFHGYTNVTFPSTVDDVLTVYFYDDYSFVNNQIGDSRFNFSNLALSGLPENENTQTQGLPVGSKTKILNSNQWLWSASYYDAELRLIQTITSNHFAGIDRSSQVYNFSGSQKTSNIIYFENDASKELIINKRFEYDHARRPFRNFQTINNEEVLLSELGYNELGILIKKSLHIVNGSPLQVIDYTHNIRGWLTGINKNFSNAGDPADYFNEELFYDQPLLASGTKKFDGNLSSMTWSDDSNTRNMYSFTYDGNNQIKSADYASEKTFVPGWNTDIDKYSEKNISYDLNGNIKTLDRFSYLEDIGVRQIDQLTYSYDNESNMLLGVNDNLTISSSNKGFNDLNKLGADYAYDSNGNLKKDKNKGINDITYNVLNKPENIQFADGSYVSYKYDASGIKLSEVIFENDTQTTTTTDYIDGLVFKNNLIASTLHAEGQITFPGGVISNATYEYFLSDHLGSPRVILQTKTKIYISKATMEASSTNEVDEFLNYDDVVLKHSSIYDHTNDSNEISDDGYSVQLNGTDSQRTGLAKSLSVMPGDKIKLEVFAKYFENAEQLENGATLINSVATVIPTAVSGGAIDAASLTNSNSTANSIAALFPAVQSQGLPGPNASMKYIIFDRLYNMVDWGLVRMTDVALEDGTNVEHEHLYREVNIWEAGYIYVYLANDNDTPIEVFFDDFNIEHIESPVKEINGYYPYGSIAYNWVRENEEEVNFKFQAKELNPKTKWQYFGARQYDATLGRWINSDPANQFSSPYKGMGNNPTMGVDPDGKWVEVVIGAVVGGVSGYISGRQQGLKGWELLGATFAGAGVGALSGGVGGGVSASVTASTSSALAGSIIGGAVAGTAQGFYSAGLNGASFSQMTKAGLTGGLYGAVGAAAFEGVSSVIKYQRQMGVFRNGVKELGIDPAQPVPETDAFLDQAQQVWYKNAPIDKTANFTVEHVPEDIKYLMDDIPAGAYTEPVLKNGVSTGQSNVYFNSGGYPYSPFQNARLLFNTMGHEFVHVSQYASLAGLSARQLRDPVFRGMLEYYGWQYDYHLDGKVWTEDTSVMQQRFPTYFKSLNWRNFSWTSNAIFKYPFK